MDIIHTKTFSRKVKNLKVEQIEWWKVELYNIKKNNFVFPICRQKSCFQHVAKLFLALVQLWSTAKTQSNSQKSPSHHPSLLPSFKGSQEDNTCSGHLPQTMQVPTQGPSPRMTTTTEFTRIWTASHVRPKVQLRPTLLGVQARARKNDFKPSCKGLNNCWSKGRPKGPRALVECLK